MSLFAELGQEYKEWRNRYFTQYKNSQRFLYQFAQKFSEFLEAPSTFKDMGNREEEIPYIYLMKAVEQPDGTFKGEKMDSPMDELPRNEAGEYLAMIMVRLEEAANVWPKQSFPVLLRFRLDGNHCEMRVANAPNGPVHLEIDDAATFVRAHQEIFDHLRSGLRAGWGSRSSSQGIGFMAGMPKPERSPGG